MAVSCNKFYLIRKKTVANTSKSNKLT